jgi:glycosyltransferase involved in cell wall biosynthesis
VPSEAADADHCVPRNICEDDAMNTDNIGSANEAYSGQTASVPLTSLHLPVTPESSTAIETVPILHLINGEHYAGAERVQDLLAKRLPEFGFSVAFACVKLDVFDAMRESRDAPLYDVPMRTKFDLRAARSVAKIIGEGGYRVLHAHTVRTAMVGGIAARMAGVPMVYHAHSPASHDSTRRWADWINGQVERWSLRRASRVIAVSHAMADYIAHKGFDPARITVVTNGVPSLAALPDRPPPGEHWTLGMVALFRPRKGLEVLLDAMVMLRQHGIDLHLRAVGTFESPKYEAEIAARVWRLHLNDQISWSGFTQQVGAELRKMDLLVLPSLFGEGLPMVVLEAMAAGVPVVATRVPGVPEAIRHGEDGVLVNPNDPVDLARAIAYLVQERYNWGSLRASAFQRHAERFSDRAMAASVAVVYKDILGVS